MKWFSALMCAAALTSLALLPAQASGLSKDDASYLTITMQAQLGRYALGTLAMKNAHSPKVKAFAKALAGDAGAQTRHLDAMAKRYGLPIAKQPDVRASYHYSQLSGLHGAQFDRRFIQDLQIGDSVAVEQQSAEAKNGANEALKKYAQQRLQALNREQSNLGSLHA